MYKYMCLVFLLLFGLGACGGADDHSESPQRADSSGGEFSDEANATSHHAGEAAEEAAEDTAETTGDAARDVERAADRAADDASD